MNARTVYTSTDDYIDQVVVPALGEYVEDYDVQGIAKIMLEWHDELTPAGDINLDLSGLVERTDLDFWNVVAALEA